MPLGRAVGKVVDLGRRTVGKGALGESRSMKWLKGGIIGGAAVGGAGSAILDPEGPYTDIQRDLYGDPSAFRMAIRGAVKTSIGGSRGDISGPARSYYGQPVDIPGMADRRPTTPSGRTTPVPGETVFGMYGMRR